MPVELRKRKAPPAPAPAPPAKKKAAPKKNPVKAVVDKVAAAVTGKDPATNGAKLNVGETVDLTAFGGEVETDTGEKTTLKALVDKSANGVVVFTYPKASTPGCTTQACLFRDNYAALTGEGFDVYGLSTDPPSANTKFKTAKSLPYTLLCDPKASLINALGLKKSPKGTQRGVAVIAKDGKVLAAGPGSPEKTLEIAKSAIGAKELKANGGAEAPATTTENEEKSEGLKRAETAAEVADTAAAIDGGTPAGQ
jgi:peroxiredoxin Q/BCP